eukprot:scaffold6068_cov65-Attheya_sp.AAC.2
MGSYLLTGLKTYFCHVPFYYRQFLDPRSDNTRKGEKNDLRHQRIIACSFRNTEHYIIHHYSPSPSASATSAAPTLKNIIILRIR